ncbi:peptidoglycan DD-metalloendopeptidase family protein [Kaistia dalseonensis]|uniref:Septal ring factor EnvC (AmiA/AmiB activator) n=1 Tax=Kaistia dalseonensis TaxID=410840 RepID=A0ABU0H4M6_9HYPH|nr:peptidoglycan DD-metalloendopeptidase family protein [Kaistia dalseonensis]MCX5494677.1 peptidoglycan DD-metalloendopeptidase family protein [Kaistia dalseonensis]MDQ0437258.1 septal ring factor EnvC (AmiA/AmiB activator) [Kaistia dalseonensis]
MVPAGEAFAVDQTQGAAPDAPVSAAPVPAADAVARTQEQRSARRAELDAITHDIEVTQERQAALQAEMAKLDQDRASLNQTLIDTSDRAQQLEKKVDEAEQRMGSLLDEEKDVHASLAARRNVLANVLAALQRMGRKPPPAIVVRPQDALSAVRSAMLLGAVVPELRSEAGKLADDLQHLVALKSEQQRERDRMRADATALAEERTRIEILVEEKRKARASSEEQLVSEQQHSEELAKRATDLKGLIASLEEQLASASNAAEAARRAEAANQAAIDSGTASRHPDSLGAADRIAPAVAFADAKGLLPKPVSGVALKNFGDADGLGGTTQGLSIATRAGSGVSSPADGWVVYAGPFRSYGQLLIINAGGGYHILLAGMERIDVELGQFVLAGEPVAVMGSRLLATNSVAGVGATQPVLYVEFRKDGTSIDPAPWWARSNDEKVGG